MCGIIGIVQRERVAGSLVAGLKSLEYRGYDSAGIATLEHGRIERVRAEGKVDALARRLEDFGLEGSVGIGHTRWATHGPAVERNAHPHATARVAVVHNGIVENHAALRASLTARGRVFESDTDTEVIVHLVDEGLSIGQSPHDAVASTIAMLRGSFAIAAIFRDHDDLIVAARVGSPLVVGRSATGAYVASDAAAIAPWARHVAYLEDGDIATIHFDHVDVDTARGRAVRRPFHSLPPTAMQVDKKGFAHFMAKEIHEQPTAVGRAVDAYFGHSDDVPTLPGTRLDLASYDRISIVGCGTSHYAGATARTWFERIAGIPVDLEVASEYRYRDAPITPRTLTVCISQSGETADTLSVLRMVKERGQQTVGIVNVPGSSLSREADWVLETFAGPEIGVASTKAYATQLVVLAALALRFAEVRGRANQHQLRWYVALAREIPDVIGQALACDAAIRRVAASMTKSDHALFVGRGTCHALAQEGALKLKEISYVHAEAFAAGELKHGPLALVDESMPVVVVAPHDETFEKTCSNAQEIAARGGRIVALTDAVGEEAFANLAEFTVRTPKTNVITRPFGLAIPLQLLAYHVATLRGTDVDRPRNLAKSVTVE